ncbi:cytochrome P450 [Nocardia cyriacigeorgica]|uniref:cytochrome P450 n=1 Tax=Nocardia cyriacigeorgica TaxID=135487 RepID=UPI00189542BF|nr:cytochrome P450 [Nocardia cyriacigeorgica]MBF6086027.1 cytochrome P450 [Nocardia cyriacigeorgica]MBF6394236.1 cytochrome P450 [Nocardia cyriacigeorgica]MBF6399871.1 cytochrome P450 [Nocardia cyriacigeorgica]
MEPSTRAGQVVLRRPRAALVHAAAAGVDFQWYFRKRRERDGDPFLLPFPGLGEAVFTGTPEGAREVFRAPVDALVPPRPNPIEPLVGTASLILTGGERHRRDRALLAPALHGTRVRAYGELIAESVRGEVDSWRPGTVVDARSAATAITLGVILDAVFGVGTQHRTAYIAAIGAFLGSFSGPLMLAPVLRHGLFGLTPWDRFVAARGRLDQLLLADITERRDVTADDRCDGTAGRGGTGPRERGNGAGPQQRNRAAGEDIASTLLGTCYDDGSTISDHDLCDQLRTLLVAGHETTANTLVWALLRVHREPAVLHRLRDELRDAGPEASPEELLRLPYLDAVCQETLRLHPAVPIVLRRLTAPYTLRGAALAPDDIMGVAIPLLHSDPAVWSEPDRFRPERFLDRRYTPFEFAPFGGGHRRCVGAALADIELRIALAIIVGRTRLRLAPAVDRGRLPRALPRGIATGPSRRIRFTVLE